jgi:hypothetical protein
MKGKGTMENDYMQLSRQAQSFIDLLRQTRGGAETEADGPHVEQVDFDQLCELLSAVREKLDLAQKSESEMHAVRRRLAGRIAALRRSGTIIAGDGRPGDDSPPADDVPLSELIRIYEEETARLHRATTPRGRTTQINRGDYRKYREFK